MDQILVIVFALMFVIMFSHEKILLFHGFVSLLSNLLDVLADQETIPIDPKDVRRLDSSG